MSYQTHWDHLLNFSTNEQDLFTELFYMRNTIDLDLTVFYIYILLVDFSHALDIIINVLIKLNLKITKVLHVSSTIKYMYCINWWVFKDNSLVESDYHERWIITKSENSI